MITSCRGATQARAQAATDTGQAGCQRPSWTHGRKLLSGPLRRGSRARHHPAAVATRSSHCGALSLSTARRRHAGSSTLMYS
eukprot:SM000190S04846  [mRNA]  locus=s190:69:314:+ [translate_table: standard]